MIHALALTLVACAANAPEAGVERTPLVQLLDRLDIEHPDERTDETDATNKIIRVAGDADAMLERVGEEQWKFGDDMFIDTALPVGYPRPTPPDVIEIKTYPSVRRAEVSGETGVARANRSGFMPLFRHIQRNDIAMTSPVEMDLPGWTSDGKAPDGWTMSFLYRTPELRETGAEGDVVIRDTDPVTVIAIGTRGVYTIDRFTPYLARIEAWLDEQGEWERDGDPRWFGYNGPYTPPFARWGEVQIPIRKADADASASDDAED